MSVNLSKYLLDPAEINLASDFPSAPDAEVAYQVNAALTVPVGKPGEGQTFSAGVVIVWDTDRGDGQGEYVQLGGNSTSVSIADDTTTATAVYPALASATSGTASAVKVSSTKLAFVPSTGVLTAIGFSGSGASLTALNASNLTTGTVAQARLGTGTANTTTFLRGDGTWATPSAGVALTDDIASGVRYITFADAPFGTAPNLSTKSTLTFVPSAGELTAASFSGSGASLTALNASNLTTGTVAAARLGTGPADGTTFLRGNNTWGIPDSTMSAVNDTTTVAAVYPAMVEASGLFSSAKVSTTKLTFVPSTGVLTATGFSGSGTSLTALNASNLSSGTVATARLGTGTANSTTFLRGDGAWATPATGVTLSDDTTAATAVYPALASATSGTASAVKVSSTKLTFVPSTGVLTAIGFSGSGASLTALNASNLTTGTVATARLGTGTASSSTFLRGDGTWATPTDTTAVTLSDDTTTATAVYPALASATSGTTAAVKVSSTKLTFVPSTGVLTAIGFSGSGASLTALNASNLTTGTVATARLGTGTASSSTFLRGDGTWATPTDTTVVSITNDVSAATTHYPALLTASSGTTSGVKAASTKLSFLPSTGVLTATGFSGSGASLTGLNADQLTTGTVPTAALGAGAASSSTYLRGDNTWGLPAGNVSRTATTSGITHYPMLSNAASGDTSATYTNASLTYVPSNGLLSATTFAGSGASLTSLNASNLASGTAAAARLGSGTANSNTFLRGDSTWATPYSPIELNGSTTLPTAASSYRLVYYHQPDYSVAREVYQDPYLKFQVDTAGKLNVMAITSSRSISVLGWNTGGVSAGLPVTTASGVVFVGGYTSVSTTVWTVINIAGISTDYDDYAVFDLIVNGANVLYHIVMAGGSGIRVKIERYNLSVVAASTKQTFAT